MPEKKANAQLQIRVRISRSMIQPLCSCETGLAIDCAVAHKFSKRRLVQKRPLSRWSFSQLRRNHSDAAIASQIFSIAGISAWLPGLCPFTRIENASVFPLVVSK